MLSVLIIFFLIYIFFAIFHKHRSIIVWVGVFLFLILKKLYIKDILNFVDWNIIFIFSSFIIITEFMIEDKIASSIAEKITDRTSSLISSLLILSATSGIISTFLENVATVLILAPIALEISRKAKVSCIPYIMGIILMSNLEGTATLIGDPPSMILAGYMKLTFFDFFILDGKLSLFFIVQAGALSGLGTLYFIFRRRYYGRKIEKVREEKIKSKRSVLAFIFAILWLILSSFNKRLFGYAAGTGSLIISLILLLSSKKDSLKVLKRFDYDTVLILMGIFIIINVVNNSGVVQLIANFIETYLKGNVFMIFLTLIFISVFFSAFIDNVPFVTAIIPVGMKIAEGLNINQYLLTFGIIIGATVGGNITPIGASANIVGYGIIKREGEDFTFGQFVKIGFLFTFFATLFSSILLWFIWR